MVEHADPIAFMAARMNPWQGATMRVDMPVASSIVDPRMQSAFSSCCLDTIGEWLDRHEVPVTWEFTSMILGKTVPGTQTIQDKTLHIHAELAPAILTPAELEALLPKLGAGCGGRILKTSRIDQIEVIEQIKLTEIALLPLAQSCNPKHPLRKL
jgi:hypothetical protein